MIVVIGCDDTYPAAHVHLTSRRHTHGELTAPTIHDVCYDGEAGQYKHHYGDDEAHPSLCVHMPGTPKD